jgi:hypothetical protein
MLKDKSKLPRFMHLMGMHFMGVHLIGVHLIYICQTQKGDAELLDLYLDSEMYTSLYQAP